MQHKKFAGALALALVMLCTPAAAQMTIVESGQGGPTMVPPGARQNKTGTGRIAGRLVSADTGNPVRRAQIRLSSPDIMPRSTTTDNEGRYEFKDLPASRYTMSATKSGFVTMNYGQSRPFESGKPIELSDGQVLQRADITMPKGSVIAGRIIDEFGEPVADASVSALRSVWQSGKRRLQTTGRTATTNDLGQFRIYGLPPGEYYVSATASRSQEMMVAEMSMIALRTGGPSTEAPTSGYAPTYYPGTPNGGQAQKVSVAVGQEAQNTDFALIPVRLVTIKGTVIGSDGRPLSGVSVQPRARNTADAGFPIGGASGRTDANGNFTVNGVAPGEYTLTASGSMTFTTGGGEGNQVFFSQRITTSGPGGEGASQEAGSVPLSVANEDINNVIIVTSKGTSVSGRVTYEGGAKPSANTLRITAASPDQDSGMALLGGSATVNAEGNFTINGQSGPRLFRVANVPAGWFLKAIRHGGQDVTDTGIDVRGSEPITGLEVVLTNKQSEVSGTVTAGNDPAKDYTVVIFSDDPAKWTAPTGRHIASGRPNQDGKFSVKNLPPGGYYAIALEYIPQGEWYDPDVLERLKSRAKSVTINEGQVETVDLRLESWQ